MRLSKQPKNWMSILLSSQRTGTQAGNIPPSGAPQNASLGRRPVRSSLCARRSTNFVNRRSRHEICKRTNENETNKAHTNSRAKKTGAQPAVDPAELHRRILEFDRGFPDRFALVVEESLHERERRS